LIFSSAGDIAGSSCRLCCTFNFPNYLLALIHLVLVFAMVTFPIVQLWLIVRLPSSLMSTQKQVLSFSPFLFLPKQAEVYAHSLCKEATS
jgi:hypothetical protein